MEFIIKKFNKKYLDSLISLFKLIDKEFVPSVSERDFDRCVDEVLSSSANLFIALYNEKVVGFISFFDKPNNFYIDWLADHPNFRHHRVASILLEECIIKAKNLGKKGVEIGTWSTNNKALNLYKELGFKIIKTIKDDRGKGIDTVKLNLVINNFNGMKFRYSSKNDLNKIKKLLSSESSDDRNIENDKFLLAEIKNKIIGCIRIKNLDKNTFELSSLVIDNSFRGNGFGKLIVEELLKRDKRRPIYLITKSELENFYKLNKFKTIKTQSLPEILNKEFNRIINLPFAKNIKVIAMVNGSN